MSSNQAAIGGPTSIPSTCSGDGSFAIEANAAPNLDGCFLDTEEDDGPDGSMAYTLSGTTTDADIIVFSFVTDNGDFKWYIGDDSADDVIFFCKSQEAASEVNPGNASWNCDFTGDAKTFAAATEEDISIVC